MFISSVHYLYLLDLQSCIVCAAIVILWKIMYVCLLAKTRKPLDQFSFNSQGNFNAQGRFVSIYKRIAKFCKEVWPLKNNAPVIVFGFYLYPKVGIICVCVYKCLYLVNGLADKFKSLWDCFVLLQCRFQSILLKVFPASKR